MNNNEIVYNKLYTYKELQKIFNIYNKSGSQTIKEISKQYKIDKVRRGIYKIERQLTNEEKIDSLIYNKNREFIEPMIYSMLCYEKSNSITLDMHELMERIAIVNKDFNYIKWHTKECSQIMKQDEYGLKIFTKESEPMLKRIIRDILFDMEDRQLIKVNEIPIVAYKIYESETRTWRTRLKEITSKKDIQKLLEIKRIALEDFGLQKESELGYKERSEFRDLIAKSYDADYFYYKYNIILNKKGLTKYENYDIIELRKKFNAHIQDKLQRSQQGDLKLLEKEEKDIYIKYCIDISQDFMLRKGV